MLVSLDDIANWILVNRKGKAFKNYNKDMILLELMEAQKQNTLIIDIDMSGNIIGVTTAQRLLYIKNIVSSKKGSLRRMLKGMRALYHDLLWTATRRGQSKVYFNVDKMLDKDLSILSSQKGGI